MSTVTANSSLSENTVPLTPLVLIVDDEEPIRTMLAYSLERHGFTTKQAVNGDEALKMVKEIKPDIIILDWMLPGLSGIEVCTILRTKHETKNIPIIMLTAKGEEFDKVKGLDSGVDDYIVKPFSPNELVARIKAIFRRTRPMFTTKILEYKGLKIDLASYKVTRNGKEVHLGPTEFKILQCLMEYPKRILSREYIMSYVWGYDSQVETRTIDVHINRLRSALKDPNEDLHFIKTIRSAGYSLDGPGND
ncbi:MAG: phosphate regulon transcriptional regulator PhoB [Alphaproteobacteria bacterium]